MEFIIASGPGVDKGVVEKLKPVLIESSRRNSDTLLETEILGGRGLLLRSYSEGEFVDKMPQGFDGFAIFEGVAFDSASPPIFSYKCSDDFFDNARGMFCRVIGCESGEEAFVERDILGVYPIWYASYNNIDFASNNIYCIANAINSLGGKVYRNSFYSASELALENALWKESPFEGVYLLGVHEKIIFNGMGADVIKFSPWYYRSSFSYQELLEKTCEEVSGNIKAISDSRYSHKVSDLTGGYDSRMILSGIVGQGLQDNFSFFTSGVNTGDSSAASFLRNKYKLRKTAYNIKGTPGDMVDKVRRSLCASYGQHSMADYANYMPDVVECNGTMGELFRQFYCFSDDVAPVDAIKAAFNERFSVLPTASVDRIMQGYKEFFDEKNRQGFSVDEAFYHLYLEQRNQQFVGVSMRAKSNVQAIALPLYSTAGVAAALALTPEERKSLKLVYDITKKLCHELIFPPLENRVWPYCDKEDEQRLNKVTPFVNGSKDYRDVVMPVVIEKCYSGFDLREKKKLSDWEMEAREKGLRWNWKHLDKALDYGNICLESIGDKKNHEYIDLNGLKRLFEKKPHEFKRNYEVRQVWRSLFAITWLSEQEEPVCH
ncbi:hypothetical protein [Vreelandella venusta]|uniref:Uncharacterized protein n=1 Tax=Vreelandella venusta TaxID=44935 RepID=A0AAQ0CGJ9_9GAMM|nr:hypothetical protein [Halomonas venusta]QRL02092.1 hypothetical protein JDS37_12285 [Halomonas venusta]GEK52995.1 hypothetical protein HVE01_37160 [Halomonas venusta]